jgi:hypothetical protein
LSSSEGSLSEADKQELERIKGETDRIIESISRLQMTWNHGPRATRLIDDTLTSLKQVSATLSE